MKIKCKCGETVMEGSTEMVAKKGGGTRRIFVPKREVIGHKEFNLYGEILKILCYEPVFLHGEIHRNGSNDPDKWTSVCSGCQSKELPK